MAWGRNRARRPIPKCNRCIAGHRCRIWTSEGNYVQTTCAICRNVMSEQELMRPRMALVRLTGQDSTP